MRLKRRDLIIIVVLIAICLVTLIGSSYALFTRTFTSTKKVSVQSGTLKVDFTEGDRITLSNVAPMSDSDGMNTTPYTFTITNNGSVAAYYTIRNEEDSSNTLNNKYIKYRLISDSYDSGIKTLDAIGNGYYMLSSESTLAVGKSITYKLYLWLSSETDNDAQNKTYQSKIVVQSTTNSISDTVATTLLKGVGDNGSIDASDPEQTFITGTNPSNYIWYSGKLWRAVSIDPSDNSVKLVTQWNISCIPYGLLSADSSFLNSQIKDWLNDTSVDGFLGNLREPEKFIKLDSQWDATISSSTNKKESLVVAPVGLISKYEYEMSSKNSTFSTEYLNNYLYWWLLTPSASNSVYFVGCDGTIQNGYYVNPQAGIRPSVNLKGTIKITSGKGTSSEPYILDGDSGASQGTLLSTRYSGEYISFGTGENNLYRIVSHENGSGTKITSAEPLKNVKLSFDSNTNYYSQNTTIGKFLNTTYLTSYLTDDQLNLIDENTTWYLGTSFDGTSYRLAKYKDADMKEYVKDTVTARVGLLRVGELMSDKSSNLDDPYYLLTTYSNNVRFTNAYGFISDNVASTARGVKPAMNLKSNVVITGGDGTKNNPFTVALQ